MAIPPVSLEEMQRLWDENQVNQKRAAGLLVEIIAGSVAANNPAYSGATSIIVKLLTQNGRHIGTVHEIIYEDGRIPHSHPKDYTLRDCSRIRVAQEPAL